MPGRSKLHLRAGGMAKNPLNSDDEGSDSSDDDRSSSSSGTDIGLSDDASSRRERGVSCVWRRRRALMLMRLSLAVDECFLPLQRRASSYRGLFSKIVRCLE